MDNEIVTTAHFTLIAISGIRMEQRFHQGESKLLSWTLAIVMDTIDMQNIWMLRWLLYIRSNNFHSVCFNLWSLYSISPILQKNCVILQCWAQLWCTQLHCDSLHCWPDNHLSLLKKTTTTTTTVGTLISWGKVSSFSKNVLRSLQLPLEHNTIHICKGQ